MIWRSLEDLTKIPPATSDAISFCAVLNGEGGTTDILNVFNTTECVFRYGQHRKVDFSKKLKMKWLIGSLRVDSEKWMDRDDHRTQLWYCRKANLFF